MASRLILNKREFRTMWDMLTVASRVGRDAVTLDWRRYGQGRYSSYLSFAKMFDGRVEISWQTITGWGKGRSRIRKEAYNTVEAFVAAYETVKGPDNGK